MEKLYKVKKGIMNGRMIGVKLQVLGILCVALCVITLLRLGAVGNFANMGIRFFVGDWDFSFLIGSIIFGFYVLLKKEDALVWSLEKIALVILICVVLATSHAFFIIDSATLKGVDEMGVLEITLQSFSDLGAIPTGKEVHLGGGMVGAIIYGIFRFLFADQGTYIMFFVATMISLVLLFSSQFKHMNTIDIGLSDIKSAFKRNKQDDNNDEDDEEEEDEEIIEEKPQPVIIEKKETNEYTLPRIDLLNRPITKVRNTDYSNEKKKEAIIRKLEQLKMPCRVVKQVTGPATTQFFLEPQGTVRVSKVIGAKEDIGLALAEDNTIVTKQGEFILVEVPNEEAEKITIRDILESKNNDPDKPLQVALGKSSSGEAIFMDLNKMPHLLIGGTTGSGKSVCMNVVISSILLKAKPSQVKMLMIDPKLVELSDYNGIPHLLTPVITDPYKAGAALNDMVIEMERRYECLSHCGVKKIEDYNAIAQSRGLEVLPYLVIIIDELADLMVVAKKEVEESIQRIAQKARAAGMHLILATQRPDKEVVTGLIKINIPSRIAFALPDSTNSRIILESTGAEKLLGKGDMFYKPVGQEMIRLQGPFVSDSEVKKIADHCRAQGEPEYIEIQSVIEPTVEKTTSKEDEFETLLQEAVTLGLENNGLSTNMLKEEFRIGGDKAQRIMTTLTERGLLEAAVPGSTRLRQIITEEE